jgi:REP element-mobilizing transposase RayT
MSHSHTNLLYHIVFATKGRRPFMPRQYWERIHQYLGGLARGLGGIALQVGGVDNPIHTLNKITPSMAVSDFIGKLKSNSSTWMEQICPHFEWQEGYGAVSVSPSQVERTRRYIANQEEHHRKVSFAEEWGQAVEGNAQGRALELRNSVARPKKRAGLMAWKNGRQSQGSASSALGFILPPGRKAAGLMNPRPRRSDPV